MKSFNELTIRNQVLYSFLILSIICFSVLAGISILNLVGMGANTSSITSNSLEDQIERNIALASEANSQVVSRKLENAGVAVTSLAKSVEQLFEDNYDFGITENYNDLQTNLIPDSHYNETYKLTIAKNSSVYFITGTSTVADYDTVITPNMEEIINQTNDLDPIFKSIYNSHKDFIWVYVAFEPETPADRSIHRKYPAAPFTNRAFDPVVRPWYINAKAAEFNEFAISNPFVDANGQGWIISISKAVYFNNEIIGVASIDMKIGTIQENVLNFSFLDSGYATLLDDEGTVVSHPNWNAGTSSSAPTIDQIEVDSQNNPVFSSADKAILFSEESGVIEVNKNGENYLVSHSKIKNKFIYLIIVPKSEALEVVNEINGEITNVQIFSTILTIGLSLITIICIIIMGLYISNKITEPVEKLTKIAMQITNNATEKDLLKGVVFDDSLSQQDEIGQLTKSFSAMVKSLREDKSN